MEVWKPVKGYEGYYEVSNIGRVKSANRVIDHPRNKRKIVRERILKQRKDSDGYKMVNLSRAAVHKSCKVHRLVYFTFTPGNDHLQVNHMNCIKQDNRLENLEAVTSAENTRHARKNGLIKCGNRRMVIRNDGKIYPSMTAAAKDVGGAFSNMWHICNGHRKTMKGYGFKYL